MKVKTKCGSLLCQSALNCRSRMQENTFLSSRRQGEKIDSLSAEKEPRARDLSCVLMIHEMRCLF